MVMALDDVWPASTDAAGIVASLKPSHDFRLSPKVTSGP